MPLIMKKTEVMPGEIYAIPLFLPTEDIMENLKNYKKRSLIIGGKNLLFVEL